MCVNTFTCTDACMYTHIYMDRCMYVCAHICTIKCRLPEVCFIWASCSGSHSSSRDACTVAEDGPE